MALESPTRGRRATADTRGFGRIRAVSGGFGQRRGRGGPNPVCSGRPPTDCKGGSSADGAGGSATVCRMTAKEKLRQTVEDLSEAEAQDTLGFIVRRRGQRDALAELLERAPLDDEPTTPEEDEATHEARAEIARGEVLSADEIRRQVA